MPDDPTVAARTALGGAPYRALWDAVRQRLQRNGISLEGGPIRVDPTTAPERDAICGLLGRSTAGAGPLRVKLTELDGVLRRGAARIGVVELVELLGGPLVDRRSDKARLDAEETAMWEATAAHPALQRHPDLAEWVANVRRRGLATRLAHGRGEGIALVGSVLDVTLALPADGELIAVLAARLCGDAHALDRDRPLGRLSFDALASLGAGSEPSSQPVDQWRQRWEGVGVFCDEVSASVLVLNLTTASTSTTVARSVTDHAAAGEPLRLTLSQLVGHQLPLDASRPISVCENPTVVAKAARELGPESNPLVCVDGQPNSAVTALLRAARGAGCTFRYHGDFDWGGLRIANHVMGMVGATPWRLSTADYLGVKALTQVELPPAPNGLVARWDAHLVDAMAQHRAAIFEEQVVGDLVADLRRTR